MITNPTVIEYFDVLYRKGFNIIPVNAFKKPLVNGKNVKIKRYPKKFMKSGKEMDYSKQDLQ